MKLKEREIYLKAAEQIASRIEVYSCNAIYGKEDEDAPLVVKYARTMAGQYRKLDVMDIYDYADSVAPYRFMEEELAKLWHKACRDFRVMLLCMMVACCEDME